MVCCFEQELQQELQQELGQDLRQDLINKTKYSEVLEKAEQHFALNLFKLKIHFPPQSIQNHSQQFYKFALQIC